MRKETAAAPRTSFSPWHRFARRMNGTTGMTTVSFPREPCVRSFFSFGIPLKPRGFFTYAKPFTPGNHMRKNMRKTYVQVGAAVQPALSVFLQHTIVTSKCFCDPDDVSRPQTIATRKGPYTQLTTDTLAKCCGLFCSRAGNEYEKQ